MRVLVPVLASVATLLSAPVSVATATTAASSKAKPPPQVSKVTGNVTRLTKAGITVAGLRCTRTPISPSVRGVALGARVTITCKAGTLTKIGVLRPAAPPSIRPAPLPVAVPPSAAPPTCKKDTSYRLPGPLTLSAADRGVVEVIDSPHIYRIGGDTPSQIYAQIRECRPDAATGASAIVRHWLNYRYTPVRQPNGWCRLTEIAVGIHVGMVLPAWTGGPNAEPGLSSKWNNYLAALTFHEQGHIDRYIQWASQVLTLLEGLSDLDCGALTAQIAGHVNIARNAIAQAQLRYDAETDHGRAQGARLT